MLSAEDNERLTRVGADTPMGELLRRYWHPIAASAEMDDSPTKAIEVLGETLVLYKDKSGTLGLIQRACPHRSVDLVYGIPQDQGLRCPYHGWCFDERGQCLDMPAEPADSAFKSRIRAKSYPVEQLGGLIFAYLGPDPAPLLPRWDLLVWDDLPRDIGMQIIPCNWLQVMENSLDPVHVEWLHRVFHEYVRDQRLPERPERWWTMHGGAIGGAGRTVAGAKHRKIGFDTFEHGIIKRRQVADTDENHPAWRIGHPILFPNMLRVGASFEFRVPVSDTRTLVVWYTAYAPPPGVSVPRQERIPYYRPVLPAMDEHGHPDWRTVDYTVGQDMAMWISQGPIADRTRENLATSDRGIILYRQLLSEQLVRMRAGDDPMNVFRDAARNQCIEVPWEGMERGGPYHGVIPLLGGTASRYSPVLAHIMDQVWDRFKDKSPAERLALAAQYARAAGEPPEDS